jgi:adenylate cyclase
MPPEPWIVRNHSVERPFAADLAPLVSDKNKSKLTSYARASAPKAVALAPNGIWAFSSKRTSNDDAMRHSLERCSHATGQQCMVIAVDDTFVVPIPTLAKVAGFYRPEALFGIRPEQRDEVARRLAAAPNSWNAVALGTGGILGIAVSAGSEQSALETALADCAAHGGSDCRVAVLGPFLVEAMSRVEAQNQGPRQAVAPGQNQAQPQSPGLRQEEKAPVNP